MTQDHYIVKTDQKNRPEIFVFYTLIAYTIFAPMIFVLLDNLRGAVILGTLGVLSLIMTRIKYIQRLKIWGLEAELREQIDKASATVDQLRKLAQVLSEPIMSEIALHGMQFSEISFVTRYQFQQQIDGALASIGVSEKERDVVNELWYRLVHRGLGFLVLHGLDKERPDLSEEIKNLCTRKGGNPAPPDEIREFLTRNNPVRIDLNHGYISDISREEVLKDYEALLAY